MKIKKKGMPLLETFLRQHCEPCTKDFITRTQTLDLHHASMPSAKKKIEQVLDKFDFEIARGKH